MPSPGRPRAPPPEARRRSSPDSSRFAPSSAEPRPRAGSGAESVRGVGGPGSLVPRGKVPAGVTDSAPRVFPTGKTMTARVAGALLQGIRAGIVMIEVQVRPGLPCTSVIGLPDCTVRESRERVKGALEVSGFRSPTRKVLVDLASASISKEGDPLDLGIAIGGLVAAGHLSAERWLNPQAWSQNAWSGRRGHVTERTTVAAVDARRSARHHGAISCKRVARVNLPAESPCLDAPLGGPYRYVRTLITQHETHHHHDLSPLRNRDRGREGPRERALHPVGARPGGAPLLPGGSPSLHSDREGAPRDREGSTIHDSGRGLHPP